MPKMAERSLMGILMEESSSSSASLLAAMRFSVLPIVKVFTVCFMGFLMASKYVNILPPNGRRLLNGVMLLSLVNYVVLHFSHM